MPKTTDTPSDAEHKGDFAQQRRACVEEMSSARPACREADGLEAKLTEGHRADSLRAQPDLPQPVAPNMRTFTLNSREFYEAVTPPPEPHMWGPGLPSDPRVWEGRVVVEP